MAEKIISRCKTMSEERRSTIYGDLSKIGKICLVCGGPVVKGGCRVEKLGPPKKK